jgi:DNA gyrase subunit A
MIDNPSITDDEIISIIPAPDFPTGGKIIGYAGGQKLYKTGSGGVIVRAKAHKELISISKHQVKPRIAIIITELPYLTNKATLLTKIAELVNDKKLEGISDIRDESDRDGIRMVIELKREASYEVVLNNLYKKTALQTSFSGNLLAIVDDGMQPQRLSLKELLAIFVKFRFKTIRRRTQHQLMKLEKFLKDF